jgi:hypothetical protein
MKRATCISLAILILFQEASAGLDSHSAAYVGGTWNQLAQETLGKVNTTADPDRFIFLPNHAEPIGIPYAAITSIEYGQKAGRRIGATIGWGVTTLGLAALPLLLSKKRRHYLSISYTDSSGKPAGVVLELGKDITRGIVETVEFRSGKKVEYESQDAKEHLGN